MNDEHTRTYAVTRPGQTITFAHECMQTYVQFYRQRRSIGKMTRVSLITKRGNQTVSFRLSVNSMALLKWSESLFDRCALFGVEWGFRGFCVWGCVEFRWGVMDAELGR